MDLTSPFGIAFFNVTQASIKPLLNWSNKNLDSVDKLRSHSARFEFSNLLGDSFCSLLPRSEINLHFSTRRVLGCARFASILIREESEPAIFALKLSANAWAWPFVIHNSGHCRSVLADAQRHCA